MNSRISKLLVIAVAAMFVALTLFEPAFAQRRGGGGGRRGGGGGMSRGMSRPSVSRPSGGGGFSRPSGGMSRPSNPGRPNVGGGGGVAGGNYVGGGNIGGGNINRGNINNGNINRGNINTGNINRPVNVGDVDINSGWGWNDGYHGCCHHPVAAGAAIVAGAAITAAAIGSVTYALPADCIVTVVNGVTYNQCGSSWYQPVFNGTTTTYTVVNAP
jgi:hypothetical protein